MSAIPLLLQCPQTPTSPSPIHPPLPRRASHGAKLNNRNSFPPDQSQESRWATLLARATPARPYGACTPAAPPPEPAPTPALTPAPTPGPAPAPALALTPTSVPAPAKTQTLFNQQQVSPAAPHPAPPALRPSPTGAQQPPAAPPQQSRSFSSRPLVPTVSFNRALTSPTAIKLFNPSRRLNKTQSQLIMPRMKSLFRTGQGSRSKDKKASRQGSMKSLSNYNEAASPEPLIRKSHTVLALSSTPGAGAQTKLVKEGKSSKLDFFRRMSSSKSAVFNTTKFNMPRSPSTVTDLRRLRKDSSMLFTQAEHEGEGGGGCSRCASLASVSSKNYLGMAQDTVFCKLCLSDVSIREMYQLQQCLCRFCKYCMAVYVALKIREGDDVIECPDANCDCSGELTLEEMESLVGSELYQLHLKFRKNREVDMDPMRVWCPMAGCETVVSLPVSKHEGPQCTTCPTCTTVFCASCSESYHPSQPCHADTAENMAVPLDDTIKRCPSCRVLIERDAGCAQMLCKKCKHVFCWYCLTSLDDDFLLRHYDKGPCKNKLGHSRASVLWHRAQVIGIFAGFGLLLVVASPLLLFVGPCLLCCKCKPCSKHEMEDDSLYGI